MKGQEKNLAYEKTGALPEVCETLFDLENLRLSPGYYYDSLPLCAIDAVFSIGVRYTSTQKTVKNYCDYFGIREYNLERDTEGDKHTISQFVENLSRADAAENAGRIFMNRQRTSTRNGILKAEAVLMFAKILQKYGIETLKEMSCGELPAKAQEELLCIPGQSSGLSVRYFCMLAGDDNKAKPDRHILRFLKQHTGQEFTVLQAQKALTRRVKSLAPQYPNLTVRLLDYTIWNYMVQQSKRR
ncbi:hypothetical protein [Fournierella sp.]|uniref:hypothetical protein n=1 Tax=Allofournierella sp. TaxID=1940256 RepID=UPI003078C26C